MKHTVVTELPPESELKTRGGTESGKKAEYNRMAEDLRAGRIIRIAQSDVPGKTPQLRAQNIRAALKPRIGTRITVRRSDDDKFLYVLVPKTGK